MWVDALVTNVDRTAQNPNLLWWHGQLWLIDHGAALYWHHAPDRAADPAAPFAPIRDHVLLPYAGSVDDADERLASVLTEKVLHGIAARVPAVWLDGDDPRMYVDYFARRLAPPRAFVREAERARG